MKCGRCREENRDGRKFCAACGESLAVACSACATTNEPGAKYCGECGSELVAEGATPNQIPNPSPNDGARNAYTPKHLADKILQSRSALEGERKQVTVMFADVRGSMDLAERLDPEEWHHILERFFEILTQGVHQFEGTVNQYTGDGIMALFGAPIAHEDHAQRACHVALHLLDRLREFSREIRREHGLDFQVRIGLNSGEVIVGKIGDDLRMDYTAQGHTVGLAQRMESLAESDACFVSSETAALVSGFFRLEDLGAFRVKGMSESLHVHRLMGVGDSRSRFDVARSHGLSRFVGRASDLGVLENALAQAAAGNGQVVGVVAEAGTGKSRLCFEFLENCRERGMRVYQARAVAHGRNIPFLPILELFRSYFEIRPQEDERSARAKIVQRLAALGGEFAATLPVLFDFLGVAEPEQNPIELGPEARQRQLLGVMQQLIASLSSEQPMVTMVEDLHWLDGASDDFLGHLVDGPSGSRSLLLVNFRPEYNAEWMRQSWYRQIPLAPLGRESTTELLVDRLGADPSIEALAEPIHRRAGGNPFFTEEIAQSLIESGRLEGTRGAYRLATPLKHLDVPGSVQAVLAARIDRLPEREKRLLQIASVIGKDFTGSLLAEVAELDESELESTLAALRRAEFIYEQALYPSAEYTFKHPLTQEVALGSQLQERRRDVHAAVAEAIDRGHAEHRDEHAALLAHHWEGAGEVSLAAAWHKRAAEWSAARDIPAAGYHWERIRSLLQELPDDPAAVVLGISARIQLLSISWRAGFDPKEVEQLFDEGQALATSIGDPSRGVQVSMMYARARCALGDVAAYLELAIQNRKAAEALADTAVQAYALGFLAEALFFAGRFPEALEAVEEGSARFPAGSVPVDEWLNFADPHLVTKFYRGSSLAWIGRIPEGLERHQRCREYCEANGMTEVVGYIQSFAAQGHYHANDAEGALACALRAEAISDELGSPPVLVSHAHMASAFSHLAAGRSADAVTSSRAALDLHGRVEKQLAGMSSTILAAALLQKGEFSAAEKAARTAIENCQRLLWGGNQAEAHGVLARALMRRDGEAAQGEVEAALTEASALIERTGATTLAPALCEWRAELAGLCGDESKRERLLRAARHGYVGVGAPLQAERITLQLSG